MGWTLWKDFLVEGMAGENHGKKWAWIHHRRAKWRILNRTNVRGRMSKNSTC